jgi:hypothetical protein
MTPISRKEARAAGLTRYFNGVPGSRGHVAERLVSSCRCIDHSDHNSRPDGTVDVLLRNLFPGRLAPSLCQRYRDLPKFG